MKKLIALLSAFIMTQAYAENITMQGTISNTCTIFVNTNGTLGLEDNDTISTDGPNGIPADVYFETNADNAYTAKVTKFTGFDTNPTLSFTPNWFTSAMFYAGPMAGQGFIDSSNTLEVERDITTGIHYAYVGVTIDTPSFEVWPTGYYEASTTVSCVPQ